MLWQLDNDQAAKETMAHNVRASAILSVTGRDARITMTMDEKKILTTKIMMKMAGVCEADPGRTIMMKTLMTMITMEMTSNQAEAMMMTSEEIMAVRTRVNAGTPARVLAA